MSLLTLRLHPGLTSVALPNRRPAAAATSAAYISYPRSASCAANPFSGLSAAAATSASFLSCPRSASCAANPFSGLSAAAATSASFLSCPRSASCAANPFSSHLPAAALATSASLIRFQPSASSCAASPLFSLSAAAATSASSLPCPRSASSTASSLSRLPAAPVFLSFPGRFLPNASGLPTRTQCTGKDDVVAGSAKDKEKDYRILVCFLVLVCIALNKLADAKDIVKTLAQKLGLSEKLLSKVLGMAAVLSLLMKKTYELGKEVKDVSEVVEYFMDIFNGSSKKKQG